jgi:outer membrane protein OmpA-like peptidoglycan-associated protein
MIERIFLMVLVLMFIQPLASAQETIAKEAVSIEDSIQVLRLTNDSIRHSVAELSDSSMILADRLIEVEVTIFVLSQISYPVGQYIFSYYAGGGLSSFQYDPVVGTKSNEAGFTTGLGFTYFWNVNWGAGLDVSLDRFSSSLSIDDLETSTPSVDGDVDNDGNPDSFNLLTRFNGLNEKQTALLVGTAVQVKYRHKLSEKIVVAGGVGPKISFTAKSESYVSDGSLVTRGHYPQYGSETILPVGPGFGELTPRDRRQNDLGVGIAVAVDLSISYKLNEGFSLYAGPYFEYQLNSHPNGTDQPLVSYEVLSPNSSESVYNSVFNSNSVGDFNRMAFGGKIGISFDLGGHKNRRRDKAIERFRKEEDGYEGKRQLWVDIQNQMVKDSLANAAKIEELNRVLEMRRAAEKADSLRAALRAAELARMAEEQRVLDSLENADKVGVIMDIRTNQLSDEELEILQLPIVFEFGSAELTEQSKENVCVMAEMLSRYPTLKFQVTGHTCDIGSAEANLEIGMKRANAIKKAFSDGGVAPDQIATFSKGEAEPMFPNTNEANRRRNRRVVVVIED